jgi:hypothetical protein
MKILSVLTAFASFLASTDAFAAPRFAVLPRSTTLRFSQAAAIDLEDETMYRYILAKAKECAFSDSATAKEAKDYLNKILELESGCISGVLAGTFSIQSAGLTCGTSKIPSRRSPSLLHVSALS